MQNQTVSRFQENSQFGPYKVVRFIGKGGMGEVYLAKDTSLDRHVALKVVNEAMSSDPEVMVRFNQEGKALARLSHPNLVTVFGVGEANGVPYLAMEYVEGLSLASYLEHGTFGINEALHLTIQILEGVAAAHKGGVIHRDLKPVNIIVDEDHRIKIIDFGIARILDAASRHSTTLGTVMGTVNYLSPEVARGQSPTIQTDLYAVGVIFFEMLTGERPFVARSSLETIERIKVEPIQFPVLSATLIPPEIQQVILKLTEKDLAKRYQSAHEALTDLKNISLNHWHPDLRNAWPRVDLENETEVHKHLQDLGFDKSEFGLIIQLAWQVQRRTEASSDKTVDLQLASSQLSLAALADGVVQYKRAKDQASGSQNEHRPSRKSRKLVAGIAISLCALAVFGVRLIATKGPESARRPAGAGAPAGTPAPATATATVGHAPLVKVFKGGEGERVTMVFLESKSDHRSVLIKFEGFGSTWDGKVLPHYLHAYGDKQDYWIAGEKYVSITLRFEKYEVYPKESSQSVKIAYSEDASEKANPDQIIQQFNAAGGSWPEPLER